MSAKGNTPEEKLAQLQRRYHLLEGEKKLLIEQAGASISSNKEVINGLSEEIRKLKLDIETKSRSQNNKSQVPPELEEVVSIKNKINALVSENAKKEKTISDLQTQLKMSERNLMIENASDCARHIRVVENRIDKAMIKFNEAQSIKRTYEGILNRLREDRLQVDHRLEDLYAQLRTKSKEYDELVKMSHEALHAKELAQTELHKFEQGLAEERIRRDKEVEEKRTLVNKRIEMNEQMIKAAAAAASSGATPVSLPDGELQRSGTNPLSTANDSRRSSVTVHRFSLFDSPMDRPLTNNTGGSSKQRALSPAPAVSVTVDDYEKAYNKLKEVTGASDVSEIIQKFLDQEVTEKHLNTAIEQQQSAIAKLNTEYLTLSKQLEDVKFSGNAITKKAAIEDMHKQQEVSSFQFDEALEKYNKMAKILSDIITGTTHLAIKLGVTLTQPQNNRTLTPSMVHSITNNNVEEVLAQCEEKLKLILMDGKVGDVASKTDGKSPVRVKILPTQNNAVREPPRGKSHADVDNADPFLVLRKSHRH